MTQPETIRRLLAPHVDPDAVEIERAAVYTFHDLVAAAGASGRVLLAGDAAHQMPPFLGQGLGAGLRDAWALAPLLAAVVHDDAPLATLDAYERRGGRMSRPSCGRRSGWGASRRSGALWRRCATACSERHIASRRCTER